MHYPYRQQPLKGLFLTYQIFVTLFIRVPLWIVLNTPRSWRPRESWSLKRALLVNAIRQFVNTTAGTGPLKKLPNHLAITPGVEIDGVWVEPVDHLVTGNLKIWAEKSNVTSVRLPGYWTHKKGSSIEVASAPLPGEKVIYSLHGGAYIRLSAHPTDPTAGIARGLLKHVDPVTRVFAIEYRLASSTPFPVAYPFPTQLIDALAGYNYLVNIVGVKPDDIVVVGDSAGGNLAHALVRYLTDYQGTSEVNLPGPPGALLLLSPWVNIGTTHETLPNGSAKRFFSSDYIISAGGRADYAKASFLGPHGLDAAETNHYISPASLDPDLKVDFKNFPRTFIVSGGAEILYDQIKTFSDRMIADLGEGNGAEGEGKVRYFEAPDGIHDYLIFSWHEPERTNTFKEINRWITAA